MLPRTPALLLLIACAVACGDDGAGSTTTSSSSTTGGGGASSATTASSSASSASSATGTTGSGGTGGDGGSAPAPCTATPPPSLLWAEQLAGTRDQTLGGHGHADGKGPVLYCEGAAIPGEPFFRLVAAGVEVDFDIDGDGSDADDFLPVDFYEDPPTFTGFGESGGRVSVYVQIIDGETGDVLSELNAPDIRVVRSIEGGPTEYLPLTSKPPNEFQTNFPMVGGGATYSFSIDGASDRVEKLRLPVNHHVSYVLVFRREAM